MKNAILDVVGPPLRKDDRLMGGPGEETNTRLYRRMLFIRRFEERLLLLFEKGLLQGTTHASIGQEADAVGVAEHLGPDDHLFSNHRCHGHYLALTGDALGLLAEIMGKRAGLCAGIGGSQHLAAPGFKSNGIQGGILPAAAGIAMAKQLQGASGISLVFIGDGTLGQGVVYETLNIASLWRLPLLVVLEDNGWAQSTPVRANLAGDMGARFRAFGLEVAEIDTTDVLQVTETAGQCIQLVRRQRGPRALIIHTYRLCHHSKNDDHRPAEEVRARWAVEPLAVHGARLGPEVRRAVHADVEAALDEVFDYARSLP